MVPFWFQDPTMPTTLTLKNIPDELYARLKVSAEVHRRSLNGEAIVCLEQVLLPSRLTSGDRLARARALRHAVGTSQMSAEDVDHFKREGRA